MVNIAAEVARLRLAHQLVVGGGAASPLMVVSRLGAMQAQDYQSAVHGIALRTEMGTVAKVEQAVTDRKIVRTWPMRGTLHFVPADDVQWMLKLLTPRIIAGSATRVKNLELDTAIFRKAEKVFIKALAGDKQLTREALLSLLSKAGIAVNSQRGYHILWRLAQEGLICFANRSGKQPTFALLDDWAPDQRKLEGDAALAELALRYFTSHGPATLQDFVWWSGLKVSDARTGIEGACAKLGKESVGTMHYWMSRETVPAFEGVIAALLPAFDEYLLGYRDRSAVLAGKHANRIVPGGNGVFLPTIVVDGQVVGTWKRSLRKDAVMLTASPFIALKKTQKNTVEEAVQRLGSLLETKAELAWEKPA